MSPFDLAGLRDRLEAINKETEQEGFWDSKEKAQKLLKEKKSIENSVSEYEKLESTLDDVEVLIEMAEESEKDASQEELAELENLGVDALRHHSLSVVSMLSPGMRIDPEEAHAMQMARLRARLAADEFEVRRMRRALDCLREDEYFPCIELYYFRRKGDAYIAEKLYRDISTVRRNRRRLVRELAGILYY